MKLSSYKDYFQEADDMSRRSFLGQLGRGAAAAATVPWTKLVSVPELATKVAAPFKIGAGSMLNPQALYRFYKDRFEGMAIDSGLTAVKYDETGRQIDAYHGGSIEGEADDETVIPIKAFSWVAKNMVDGYVDDIDHDTDSEGETIAPTLGQAIGDSGEEEFLDNDEFPEWAKDLLRKDEEDMTDEEYEKYEQLGRAKWFDAESAENWDHTEEELEGLLQKWTGWKPTGAVGRLGGMSVQHPDGTTTLEPDPDGGTYSLDQDLLPNVFDHFIDLTREGKSLGDIFKMNFKQEFLPGVTKRVRRLAVIAQARLASNLQKYAAQDAKIAKGELQKDQLPKRPGDPADQSNGVEPNVEWWTEEDFKWWDRRFDDDVIDSDKIEQYKVIADKIIDSPFDSGLMEFKPEKAKELKQQAHEWLKWYNGTKDLRKPNQAHVKHPYGVGSPQGGLQTMSYRPTFKQYFNK